MARRTGRPRDPRARGRPSTAARMGALALTHKPAYREPFEPLPGGVEFLPFGDIDALRAARRRRRTTSPRSSLEPIQGEAGVRPLPAGYLALARELTRPHGALLVARRGADRHRPHRRLVRAPPRPTSAAASSRTSSRSPRASAAASRSARSSRSASGRRRCSAAGQHGTTFGGNPVAAAAALATIGVDRARRPARARRATSARGCARASPRSGTRSSPRCAARGC